MSAAITSSGLPRGIQPYDWALKQLRVPQAHRITRGSARIIVALIDLGYRHHPDLDGHLWCDPASRNGPLHGWDCADDDASLEYRGVDEETSAYLRGHHVFVAGEIAATAPECPIMIVRQAYGKPDSFWKGIRYAVDHGARVLVIPHAYLSGQRRDGVSLWDRGTDFSYPFDNLEIRRALEYAADRGCLIVKGTADNRGRRVVSAECSLQAVMAVGSSNRRRQPADVCCSADYVEVGAPAGQRHSRPLSDRIWGCGPDGRYISFTGGCMASGFAGGVAALVWSRFPELTADQLRQVLRNTASPPTGVPADADGWEPKLGFGILDAAKAVALDPSQLCQKPRIEARASTLVRRAGVPRLRASLRNAGAFDVARAVVIAYSGDPRKPAVPPGQTAELVVRQIGHWIGPLRGLHRRMVEVALTEKPRGPIWLQVYSADRHGSEDVQTVRLQV